MPASFLIIDGYNLMHAAGYARESYGPGDLQRVRRRFLLALADRLPAEQRSRTTIVFDAGERALIEAAEPPCEGMTLLFSHAFLDADTHIEKLLREHSAPKQVLLVSGDHRLQQAARRRKANFVSSERFWERLPSAQTNTMEQSPEETEHSLLDAKQGGEPDPDEIARWLEIFAEPDNADDTAEIDFWQSRIDELDEEQDRG